MTQLRFRAGLRRSEYEFEVAAAARLELQLGPEDRLETFVPAAAVGDPQDLRHRVRIIRQRRIDGRGREQPAAAGFQFLFESGEHSSAPIARGYQSDAASMTIIQYASRGEARFIFR